MVIVYAIIMSLWKQYGGMNIFEKAGQIDAYSITVNKLNIKESYQGTFDICGQLIVHGDSLIDGTLTVTEGMDVSGDVIIGEPGSFLTVNSDSIFNGSLQLNSAFGALGNIQSGQNIIADRDVLVGRVIDFSGGSFLYSSGNALGLNTLTPGAALDISTNFINGIIVHSSNEQNENILAQNGQNKGIRLGVDLSSAYMVFNYDTPIPGLPDGGISYTSGGYLSIDVSKNVNISCPLTVSLQDNHTQLRSSVFTVYDVSQSVYFGNIYQNGEAYTGLAGAFVSDSNSSNVFTFMGTPMGEGLFIGGGAYPIDTSRAMGTLGLTDSSGIYNPAQVIVSGNLTSHSLTTTGINTYQPRINSYVLDVNGPIHVDNGDIVSIDTSPSFELYSISVAPNNRNLVVGLGSSIEVLQDIPIVPNPPLPKENLLVSYNGGLSWGYADVSNSAGIYSGNTVLKGNTLNNIHIYDDTNWFITGENNMIANTYDGGISWQNISTSGLATGANFKNVYINPTSNLGGNVFGYFSADVSLVLFEVPINGPFITTVNETIISSQLSSISAVRANSQTIYVAGNAIAKFNASNSVINQTPSLQWKHSYGTSYSYNDLQIFDNSYVMAVGGNIISTTTDGGASWRDISFNLLYGGLGVHFTSVHMADISNAIAVGSQGNIWITNNQGASWSPIPLNLINSSGQAQSLLNGNNRFRNVVMTDNNTILITNTLQSYNYFTNTYGKSNLFTVYSPNFINRVNNMVLDISGGVRISGDMYINDGGVFGSNNTHFSLLNSGVKNLYLGGDTTSIVIGSLIGNTEIRNNGVMSSMSGSTSSTTGALTVAGGVGVGGNINVAGRMNVISDASFNGNVIISTNTNSSNTNTGALVIKGGVGIAGNLYVGGTFGFANDLDLSGNLTVNNLTLSSGNLYSGSSIMNISSRLDLPGGTNIRIGQGVDTVTINGNTGFPNSVIIGNTSPSNNVNTGALVVVGGVGIGGNLNIGNNLTINRFSNFISDASFNGNVLITNTRPSGNFQTGALIVSGGIGVRESVNIRANLSVGQSSTFTGVSNFVSDVSLNGVVRMTANTSSSNVNSGTLIVRGGVGVSENVNIGGNMNVILSSTMNGNVLMTSTTSSTNPTTGALIVSGGVGIGGNLNVGGFSNFMSDTSFNGNVIISSNTISSNSTSGALVVSGGVGIDGNLNVNGKATFTDTSQFIGNVFFSGNASFNDSVITNKIVATEGSFRITSDHVGPTTFYIGRQGQNDVCQILGTLSATTRQETVAGSQTFTVNQTVGNATAKGAGINIFDNSGAPYNSIIPRTGDPYREEVGKENIFAYMHVGNDLQSFVFKAPSWGSTDRTDPETQPYLISPENRVRVAVNELTMRDISNVIRRGLLILQPDISFQTYQYDQNHYYGVNTFNPNIDNYGDADYSVSLCPDFDISNILLKSFDTVVGTQSIATNLNIGSNINTSVLTVFGNSVVNGNTILNGNVGIGTTNPLLPLDVSGSARFVGPLVSTNYDTLRFSTNYGQSLKNNLNQATTNNYYQDCAISYDGQYQYGLLYNKTGFGSVNVSRNYGDTWTTTNLPINYSGNIIYQAVPYMNANTVSFPFNSLAANITLANAIPLNIQTGTYVVSGSSFQSSSPYYNVFDNSITTVWQSLISGSGTGYSNGIYSGSVYTTTTNSPSTIAGEYVQINLPYSFCLRNYQFYPLSPPTSYNSFYPSTIYVCGSNNNSNWVNLTPTGNNITIPIGANPGGNTFVSISNNTSYNSYRFIVNSTVNNALSNTQVIISRIDLSGIFQNPTGSFSSAMSTSGTGQYTTIANQGYYAGQGSLLLSSNYGASFTDTGVRDTGAVWQNIALNQTGNVQVAVSQNRSGFGNIFMSYNSGGSWSNVASQVIRYGWQTVSISSTGQYITAIAATFANNVRGNILISSNSGSTFTQPSGNPQIYNYIEPVNGFLNLGMSDFNKTVAVSSSGRYQTALGLALSSQLTGTANIWISSNYGLNWRDTGAKAPFLNGLVSVFTSITMNGSGQNQIATYMTGNIITGLRSQVSGNALVSSDYGNTWATSLDYRVPSVSSSGNVYYGGVTKVQSSLNGQYVFGINKYQDICGNTYTNTTNTAFGVGNIYLSSVPVTSNMFSTQYFGSSHTGNVFQTHGLELSVPNANNASIIAGYDVNWDAGYINSVDETGTNSLCLNTTGGFVGIGKIAPAATLDVNGNAIISGGLTIGGTTNFASNSSFNTISITSTNTSTTTTNGALTVAGGVGIGENINVGGFSAFTRDSSFSGNILLTQLNNPLWLVSRNASTINSTLSSNANDVGIFYGNTNPAAASLIISPRGAGGGIKLDTNGRVGINTSSPRYTFDVTGIIGLDNSINNKKLVLYDTAPGDNPTTATNFYGFGINSSMLRYQTDSVGAAHAFFCGATENMRITSSRVGINTASPTVALDVVGAIKSSSSITGTSLTLTGSISGATSIAATSISLSGTGSISGATSISATSLSLSGAISGATATNTINGVIINNSAVSNVTTLSLSGAITGATATNTINGVIINNRAVSNVTNLSIGGTISGATTITASGQISALSFNATSDYRMKKNTQPILITRTVDLLKPVEYDLSGGTHDMGFLAHEVQEVLPFLVAGEKDGEENQSLNYNGFIALLVKEIQDLKKENRELKERMDRLEQRLM